MIIIECTELLFTAESSYENFIVLIPFYDGIGISSDITKLAVGSKFLNIDNEKIWLSDSRSSHVIILELLAFYEREYFTVIEPNIFSAMA